MSDDVMAAAMTPQELLALEEKIKSPLPWVTAPFSSHKGATYIDPRDVDYLKAAANHAPDYARRLVELEKELEATRKERDEAQHENRRMRELLDAVGPVTIACGQ